MSEREQSPNLNRRIVRKFRLGEEPADDLSSFTTPAERFELVRELTLRLAEFHREPAPDYTRRETPIRVIRP